MARYVTCEVDKRLAAKVDGPTGDIEVDEPYYDDDYGYVGSGEFTEQEHPRCAECAHYEHGLYYQCTSACPGWARSGGTCDSASLTTE